MRAHGFQQPDRSPSSDPDAAAVPGQITSQQIDCTILTVAAREGSCSIQSCWHHTTGYVCMLSLDQGGNTAVWCEVLCWWVGAHEAFHGNLWKILNLIFLSGFLLQQFTAGMCVYRDLLGCPFKCLNNIVSTWHRLICILATVSSSRWAKNQTESNNLESLS